MCVASVPSFLVGAVESGKYSIRPFVSRERSSQTTVDIMHRDKQRKGV